MGMNSFSSKLTQNIAIAYGLERDIYSWSLSNGYSPSDHPLHDFAAHFLQVFLLVKALAPKKSPGYLRILLGYAVTSV